MNTEDKWNYFRNILNSGISECIPIGKKYKSAMIEPGWLNFDVKRHIKEKKKKRPLKMKGKGVIVGIQTLQRMQ